MNGVSQVLHDCFATFSNGFADSADVIASSLLAKVGVYQVQKEVTDDIVIGDYLLQIHTIRDSYIWSELHSISSLLRYSVLYNTVHIALQEVFWMNDTLLSKQMINFKSDIATFIKTHAIFLAYCDMEQSSLFLYTSGFQALCRNTFLTFYDSSNNDLYYIAKKYHKIVPKSVMTIIDELQNLIDVREHHGDDFVIIPMSILPRFPKFTITEFKSIISLFPKSNLTTMTTQLEFLYSQMVPFHVLSTVKWMIKMQGEKTDTMLSLTSLLSKDRVKYIREFQQETAKMDTCMKRELLKFPFMYHVFKLINDEVFLENYSLSFLGESAECIISNSIRLYLRNIPLLVLADMLFAGFNNVVSYEKQPKNHDVQVLITKFQNDLQLFDASLTSKTMKEISISSTRALYIALKKVQRFHRWLCIVNDVDETPNLGTAIDNLFGNVNDSEGNPLTCAICLDNAIEKKDMWWKLHCNHMFHCGCITNMIDLKHTTCPLCRSDI